MKQMVFHALAVVLILGAGCKKKDDGSTEMMSAEEIADKTQEAAVQAAEKAAEVTEKTKKAVTELTVQAEDVMGDLNKSVEQVKEKVATFDKTQLMAYANTYKDVILEKKDQLDALAEKLKGLSAMELIGEKGKALKNQLTQYTDQLNALKERYAVYLEKLEAFGVDLSAYGL